MSADTEHAEHEPSQVVTPPHEPPAGASTTLRWGEEDVHVSAGWTVLRRAESPSAEVFTVAYVRDPDDAGRPVTFVFNGGPGASSAFLHLGGIGPRRTVLPDDGGVAPMPVQVADNPHSWLAFTDLVFVDPVGTGFSRMIPKPHPRRRRSDGPPDGPEPDYLTFSSDLSALSETVSRWLSSAGRWTSPVFIAGESYGGYRVARLAKTLHQDEGVGLAGAMMISPAIEILPLTSTDYSIGSYIDVLPTMALAALHHGLSRAGIEAEDRLLEEAGAFARGPYVQFLAQGASMPAEDREAILRGLADLLGLPLETVRRCQGRLTAEVFRRELLRDERLTIGLYDTTVVLDDPFPGREAFDGPDPTLHSLSPAFASATNHLLRTEVGLQTDRRYELLSMDVNTSWKPDDGHHALEAPPGAADDLRYGLALNPHLRVLLTHGRHDLVTPPGGSQRVVDQMALVRGTDRIEVRTYDGGHMYYTRAASLAAWSADTAAFVASCLSG